MVGSRTAFLHASHDATALTLPAPRNPVMICEGWEVVSSLELGSASSKGPTVTGILLRCWSATNGIVRELHKG